MTSHGGAPPFDPTELCAWAADALGRCADLMADLADDELAGPREPVLNPLLWELGHVAWFAERFCLRDARGEPPLRPDADAMFDSIAVHHDARWDLALATRPELERYARDVTERIAAALRENPAPRGNLELPLLSILHADMHAEAFTYSRQTRGLSPPPCLPETSNDPAIERVHGDVEVPGGRFHLGATDDAPFAFDNERRAHAVDVAPFRIARTPVTEAEFAAFVLDGGYTRRELWSSAGALMLGESGATMPLYWRRKNDGFEVRVFDRWRPLEPDLPVSHVSAHEADAYCRWAQRRLPTELEWEVAASGEPGPRDTLAPVRRSLPWGTARVDASRARVDGRGCGPISVHALAESDSAFGCRQMLGNVWEWTASEFGPYPGFTPGAYVEYSEPWFGSRRVLRGGAWATRSRLVWCSLRNFFEPERRDVIAGFRTCALD